MQWSLIVILIGYSHALYSQSITFEKLIDYDHQQDKGYSVLETDSGYLILSQGKDYIDFPAKWILHFITLDKGGNVLDKSKFGDTLFDYGFYMYGSLKRHTKGGYFLGLTEVLMNQTYNPALMMLEKNLDIVFLKSYGTSNIWEFGVNAVEARDGGYVISGHRHISQNTFPGDFYLIKTDSVGNKEWEKIYYPGTGAYSLNIENAFDGGYIFSGYRIVQGKGYDAYVMKVDSAGNKQWEKSFGGIYTDGGAGLTLSSDSTYVITYSYDSLNNSKDNPVFVKLDSNGNEIWRYRHYHGRFMGPQHIKEVAPGKGYVVVGYMFDTLYHYFPDTVTTYVDEVGFILRLDNDGNLLWERRYSWYSENYGHHVFSLLHAVETTSDGGFIATGYSSDSSTRGIDIWVLKLDSLGCLDGYCGLRDTNCWYKAYPDCNDVGINEWYEYDEKIVVFPNPTDNYITIKQDHLKTTRMLYLFKVNGQKVLTKELKQATSDVDISSLPHGLYIYYISEKEKVLMRGRLVVE